jgi:MFS family permease
VGEVSLYRFLAGLGLGGALPAATALIAEFTPKRNRSLSVMLGIVCIPIGGMIGGVLAARLQPDYGWRMLFVVSGVLPMIVALILAIALPESPQYLLARGADTAKVAKSVRILDETAAAFGVFVDRRDAGVQRASVTALFIAGPVDRLLLLPAAGLCTLCVGSDPPDQQGLRRPVGELGAGVLQLWRRRWLHRHRLGDRPVRLANRDSDHRRRGDRRCRGPGVDAVID